MRSPIPGNPRLLSLLWIALLLITWISGSHSSQAAVSQLTRRWPLFQQKAAVDPQADGLKALDEKRYNDAAQIFSKLSAADPKDYSAHFNLGLAYSLLQRDPEAVAEYKKVLELHPGVYQAQLNLGMVLLRQKEAAAAVPYLQAAAKQKPQQFRPTFGWAEAALASGDAATAEAQYRAALAINPKSAAAELGLAHSFVKLNRIEEAEPHFRNAAAFDPAFADALLELAALDERRKNAAGAIEIYRQFPDNPAAKERLGELLLESGQAAAAIPELEHAVAKLPTAANRFALATAYIQAGKLDHAEPLLKQAADDDSENKALRMSYARVLRDERKFGPAAEQFYKVAHAKPESAEAWSELAGMLVLLEKDSQALAALDRVRALGGEKAGHFFIRAMVLDRNKQVEPAIESYEKYLELSDGSNSNQDFQARQRVRILKKESSKK